MTDYEAIIADAAKRTGVPAPLIRAVALQESGMNPKQGDSIADPAVGTERATGMMQIKPSTAKGLGVNPRDPAQAIYGGAKYLREGYDKFGNWDAATAYYHGGPDTKIWGPRTKGYTQSVAGRLGTPQAKPSSDLLADELFGNGQQPASNVADDPLANELFNAPADNRPSLGPAPNGPDNAGANGGAYPVSSGVPQVSEAGRGDPSGMPQGGAGGQGTEPSILGRIDAGVRAIDNGFLGGWADKAVAGMNAVLPIDALTGRPVESVWGGKSLADAYQHNLEMERAATDEARATYPITSVAGEVAGAIANPLSRFGAPVAGASKAVNLARLMGAGGAYGTIYGAGQSRADDLQGVAQDAGIGTLTGAALAPVGGAVGERIVAPAAKKLGAMLAGVGGSAPVQAVGDLAEMLARKTAPKAPQAEVVPGAVEQTIRTGAQAAEAPPLAQYVPDASAPPPIEVSVTGGQRFDVAAARGSRGTRTGVEANTDLPQPVNEQVQQLVERGVPAEQALREAEIAYVGGKPTTADVTRDPVLMRQTKEGAKLDTPEGQALSRQLAENNGAVLKSMTDTVANYGGKPSPGEAMESAAKSLKAAADAEYAKVQAAYQLARAQDGEAFTKPDALREVLYSREAKAQMAGGGPEAELLKTVKSLVGAITEDGARGMTPDDYNSVVRIANGKYDKMGGGVNYWIEQIKTAADDGMALFDSAGPAYKAARATMQNYAAQYRDPKGIADLIRSDARGNFLNADNWRATEGVISKTADKDFIQVVRQLKANGDDAALSRLKAHIVQNAYESATGGAGGGAIDQLGNSNVSGKMFFARLNRMGKAKLEALFTKEELAHLSTLGHAASHVNEAVPGTVNTSSTAATLANAMKQAAGANARIGSAGQGVGGTIIGATLGGLTHGFEGAGIGAAAGIAGKLAEPVLARRAASKANAELAEALRAAASPKRARSSERAAAKKLADTMIARARARRAATVTGAEADRKRKEYTK